MDRKTRLRNDSDAADEERAAALRHKANERAVELRGMLTPEEVYFLRLGRTMAKSITINEKLDKAEEFAKKLGFAELFEEHYGERWKEYRKSIKQDRHECSVLACICSALMTAKGVSFAERAALVPGMPTPQESLDSITGGCNCAECKLSRRVIKFAKDNQDVVNMVWDDGWVETPLAQEIEDAINSGRAGDDAGASEDSDD